jgi:predicted nucleic-acid-binding protein
MTPRRFIDSKIIVSYLVGGHAGQAKAAARVFEACDRGELVVLVLSSVLSESVLVLESFYEHPRAKIAAVLTTLIESPGVEIEHGAIHADALARYGKTKIHFVDCLLAAFATSRKTAAISFDQDLAKFPDVELKKP